MSESFITRAGRRIVFVDMSGIADRQVALAQIAQAGAFIAAQPRDGQVLLLTDLTGSSWDVEILEAMRSFVAHNKPYVLASAVVGIAPLSRVIMRALVLMIGRKIAVFKDLESAKDWLVLQHAPPSSVPDEL